MISDGIIVMDEYLQPRILAALLQATNIQYDYQINKIYSMNTTAGLLQRFNTIRKPNKTVIPLIKVISICRVLSYNCFVHSECPQDCIIWGGSLQRATFQNHSNWAQASNYFRRRCENLGRQGGMGGKLFSKHFILFGLLASETISLVWGIPVLFNQFCLLIDKLKIPDTCFFACPWS